MHLVLWYRCHLRVPLADELCVFIHLVWLDLVVDNGVDILATSKDLGEAPFNVFVELSAFGRAIYERR